MRDFKAPVIEGLFVSAGRRCNHRCTFCTLQERESLVSLPELEQASKDAIAWGHSRVILAGGEPTLRKDLPDVVASFKAKRLSTGLVTNGRMLLYPGLLNRLLAAGLDAVILWLHADKAALHDELVGVPGAFAQTTQVLGTLLRIPSVHLEVQSLLTQRNVDSIPSLTRWLGQIGGAGRITHTITYPSSPALNQAPTPDPGLAVAAMQRCVAAGKRVPLRVLVDGLPHCLLGDLADLDANRFAREAWHPQGGPATCLAGNAVAPVRVFACAECVNTRSCPGLPGHIAAGFPNLEPSPLRGVRSNSFDFVESGPLPDFTPTQSLCTGHLLPMHRGHIPNIMLCGPDGTKLYQTDTADFSNDEIFDIKHLHQQVYIDTSTKVALDDFDKDVKQLRMMPQCKQCPTRSGCATAWQIDPAVPFYREERWLRGEIGRMQGRVLDVGCGDLRYQEIVRGLVQKGKIEYHGLDPDKSALERLRASKIDMKIHIMDVEEYDGESGYFDYVLMLRSINHFKDLSVTFRKIQKLLRNYGSLIIADCITFALLRSRQKADDAHQSMVPIFEHYRNFTSNQVLEFFRKEKLSFVLNIHRPVVPKTSNLWLMKFIKIEKP